MRRLIEAGHYYVCKGPTVWSQIGWNIAMSMKEVEDKTLLFVDDVHQLADMHPSERELSLAPFSMVPDYMVLESAVEAHALTILKQLQERSAPDHPERLSKNDRVRPGNNNQWRFKGCPLLTPSGFPTCLLLDAGLSVYKEALGFSHLVNILPVFYKPEQEALSTLLKVTCPQISLEVVLYDLEGVCEQLTL